MGFGLLVQVIRVCNKADNSLDAVECNYHYRGVSYLDIVAAQVINSSSKQRRIIKMIFYCNAQIFGVAMVLKQSTDKT